MSIPPDQVPPSTPPPYEPVPPPAAADDRNLAMLTHLSGFLFSFIVPLIVWLVHKDRPEKAYLVTEAKEALNFQITVIIGYVICWILTIIIIGVFLTWVLWIFNLVMCIIA
ncbi:MAG TPA: DUF4870 domain-containing protein, partial [Pinirhizobacter sp.]|uniref:DUF4870 domain-containing protein n=1 Tax=Pinirhizobacter sp. TaxID=2950432 RepID=UPI002C94A2B3